MGRIPSLITLAPAVLLAAASAQTLDKNLQAGDTIYRINPDIMADAAKMAFLAAYSWADR
jgi:hypothetical protein